MKRLLFIIAISAVSFSANAQQQELKVLSLDECKTLALENNAKMKNAQLEVEAAKQTKQSTFAKHLPTVTLTGVYAKTTNDVVNLDDMKDKVSEQKDEYTDNAAQASDGAKQYADGATQAKTQAEQLAAQAESYKAQAEQAAAAAQQYQQAGDLANAQKYSDMAAAAQSAAQQYAAGAQTASATATEYAANATSYSSLAQQAAMAATTFSVIDGMLNEVSMTGGTAVCLNATLPLFTGGQINNGNKLADLNVEAKEIQLQKTRDEIILQTEQYYYQTVALMLKIKTVETADSMLSSIEKDVNVGIKAGVIMRNDSLQVQLKKNEIASTRLKLDNGINLSKLVLGQYIGMNADSFTVNADLFDIQSRIEPQTVKTDHHAALENRNESKLLQKQYEAKMLTYKMERGKLYPTVAIRASAVYHKMAFDANTTFGAVYALASVPISNLWNNNHDVKKSKLEAQMAQNDQQDLNEMMLIQMQQAYNNLQQSYFQVDIAKNSIAQADENLKISRNSYNNGLNSMSDLLQAQMLLQQAQDQLSDSMAEYSVALTNYKLLTGLE